MSAVEKSNKAQFIHSMFDRIAPHYDLLNRLMTFGQDRHWRRDAVRQLQSDTTLSTSPALDIGCGTGELAFEIRQLQPDRKVYAADFSRGMITVGRERARQHGDTDFQWIIADAEHLPFANNAFSGVISGWLLRNVTDIPQTLAEQLRILQPGCRSVCLDTTPPRKNILLPFIRLYLRYVIPILGRILTGEKSAYTYLPSSTESFHSPESLQAMYDQVGFEQSAFETRNFHTIAIHRGTKTPKHSPI